MALIDFSKVRCVCLFRHLSVCRKRGADYSSAVCQGQSPQLWPSFTRILFYSFFIFIVYILYNIFFIKSNFGIPPRIWTLTSGFGDRHATITSGVYIGGWGWTRTNVARRRRIYSPLQLPLCDSPIKHKAVHHTPFTTAASHSHLYTAAAGS